MLTEAIRPPTPKDVEREKLGAALAANAAEMNAEPTDELAAKLAAKGVTLTPTTAADQAVFDAYDADPAITDGEELGPPVNGNDAVGTDTSPTKERRGQMEHNGTAPVNGEVSGPEVSAPSLPVPDGTEVLDAVAGFLGRFVAYPSPHAHVAHTLWVMHTHLMAAWDSTPRIAFLSPERGSGKTRALEVTDPLVPRAIQTVNATPAYLFRKVADPDGAPTLLFDEIDTIFGPRAKEHEDVRGMLNAGHRRGAVAGRCVLKGKTIITEELPAYCAVAMAGLGDLPDTILSRSVVVRMRKRSPDEVIEPYRERPERRIAQGIAREVEDWCSAVAAEVTGRYPEMPEGVADRDADVWEPLIAIADAAGGDWPERARVAANYLIAEARDSTPSLGVRLLMDLRTVFGSEERMFTEDILEALNGLDESPWQDLGGHALNARGLSNRLRPYGVRSTTVRRGETVAKGYRRDDLHDPWSRYLPAAPESHSRPARTDVTDVTAPLGAKDTRSSMGIQSANDAAPPGKVSLSQTPKPSVTSLTSETPEGTDRYWLGADEHRNGDDR